MSSRRRSRLFAYVSVPVLVALAGCGGSSHSGAAAAAPTAPTKARQPTAATSGTATSATPKPGGASEEPLYDVDMSPARISEAPKHMPRVSLDVPGVDQFLPASFLKGYKIRFDASNFDAVPEGSYVQLILDHLPYRAVKPKAAVGLADLAPDGKLTDGEHIIAAFLCRPNHESVKGAGAIAVNRFWSGKKTEGVWKSNAPMLILGSPSGRYSGAEAGDILVDWYVLNAVLSQKDYYVKLLLKGPGIKEEGLERIVYEWQPYLIISAHKGDYSISVDLRDKNGNVAPGPWNSVTRTFTVDK